MKPQNMECAGEILYPLRAVGKVGLSDGTFKGYLAAEKIRKEGGINGGTSY